MPARKELHQGVRRDLEVAQPNFFKTGTKSRTAEEFVIGELATFFFEPAFARQSLMVDFTDESSDYESSDTESGIIFASMSDFGDLEMEVET